MAYPIALFTNLVSNAFKFTKGKSSAAIEIGSLCDAGEIIYFVKDNGVGFDMKYYDQLFALFRRLHSEEEFEGSGVGLAIVDRIVKRHGGRVWADSKPNEGTAVFLTLSHKKDKTVDVPYAVLQEATTC